MAYLVSISARAERDLALIYEYIQARESRTAAGWYKSLKAAILSLESHPARCAITPESKRCRHLLYGRKPNTYRVIYRIRERAKIVEILHIRHGARRGYATA